MNLGLLSKSFVEENGALMSLSKILDADNGLVQNWLSYRIISREGKEMNVEVLTPHGI